MWPLLHCMHRVGGIVLRPLLLRTLIPSDEGPTLRPQLTFIMPLKAPSPNSVTLGVRASPCELRERWGNTNIQPIKRSESRSVVSNSLRPHGLYSPWNSPGQNTGVGSLSLLQGIFLTQGSNWGLLNCRWILYQLSCQGNPNKHVINTLYVYPYTICSITYHA